SARVYRGLATLYSSSTISSRASRIPQPVVFPAQATIGLRTYNLRSTSPSSVSSSSSSVSSVSSTLSSSSSLSSSSLSLPMSTAQEKSIVKHIERMQSRRAANSVGASTPKRSPSSGFTVISPNVTISRGRRAGASHVERIWKAPQGVRQAPLKAAKNDATESLEAGLAKVCSKLETIVISRAPAPKSCLRGTSASCPKSVHWKYQDLVPGHNVHEMHFFGSALGPRWCTVAELSVMSTWSTAKLHTTQSQQEPAGFLKVSVRSADLLQTLGTIPRLKSKAWSMSGVLPA
ncbi:hypothetical protein DH86_00002087, partial [Scytalidium sp. 3C]